MKSTASSQRLTLILSLAASASVLAVPPLPPRVGVTHQSVADTLTPPGLAALGWPGLPAGQFTSFRNLGLPVIGQTTPNDRLYAFAGRVKLVPLFITAANDEGVFSNGPNYSMTATPSWWPQLLFAEADASWGGSFFGNTGLQLAPGSTLTNPSVERLQISSNGIVACQSASNDGTNNFKQGLVANNSLADLGAAGATVTMLDRAAPVMDDDCQNLSQREQWLGPVPHRVTRTTLPGGTGIGMNPLFPAPSTFFVASGTLTGLGGLWNAGQGAVSRPANPTISGDGVIASHCIDNVGPFYSRTQIRVQDSSLTEFIIMRQGTLCGLNPIPGATHFGVVNASLMALNSRSAPGDLMKVIAWQMTNMRSAPNAGIINIPSLWCRQTPIAPSCVAYVGMPAPSIPAHSFASFYALHVADMPGTTMSRIIFGANLNPAGAPVKRAIYTCTVAGGVASPPSLIATNVGTITPVLPYTPVPPQKIGFFGTSAGNAGHLFSVSRYGEILFKAQLTAPVPAANRHVLVTASPSTGYALQTWAQSGVTSAIISTGGPMLFDNFSLTQPEQGTYSRGQAIATLNTNLGTTLAYRGHAGAAQAIILAY